MALAQIGTKQFLRFRGDRPKASEPQYDLQRAPNFDGVEVVDMGTRGVPVVVYTEADTDNASTLQGEYLALKGTKQTVTPPSGKSVPNVFVLDVVNVGSRRVKSAVGGITGGDWLVQARWHLLPMAT